MDLGEGRHGGTTVFPTTFTWKSDEEWFSIRSFLEKSFRAELFILAVNSNYYVL